MQGIAQTAKTFRITSAFTSFPDTGRANGHWYNQVHYPAATHYSDSSVLIIIPPHFDATKNPDLVFWFHGWRNTIDSSVAYFELAEQLVNSRRNAVLVVPESAWNAPDSYGGKLERKGVFKNLLKDVLTKLETERMIARNAETGNIVLAGHSGAFRVIAHILQNGGVEVKQVILFDGLYGQADKFINWIAADSTHRFLHIYTKKGGGTDVVSARMMEELVQRSIRYCNPRESEIGADLLKQNRIIFIHSGKEHNDVMNKPDKNFRLFLETSPVLKEIPYQKNTP